MKPSFHLPCLALAAVLLLSACGQRGPLYLPTPPANATPAQTQPAASVNTSSAPASK